MNKQKKCTKCNSNVPYDAVLCMQCAGTSSAEMNETPLLACVPTKQEFIKSHLSSDLANKMQRIAIIYYVVCGLSLIFFLGNLWSLFANAVMLGLTRGMCSGKRRWCAVMLLAVGCLDSLVQWMILQVIMQGAYSVVSVLLYFLLRVVLGSSAVKLFFDIDKEYEWFIKNKCEN